MRPNGKLVAVAVDSDTGLLFVVDADGCLWSTTVEQASVPLRPWVLLYDPEATS